MDNIDNHNIKSQEAFNGNIIDNKKEFNKNKLLDIKNIDSTNLKESIKSTENDKEKDNQILNQTSNSVSNNEREKRQRRGKNETSDRIYKCPDCEKSYLSGPALIIHRKLKHNYNKINENKTRGRPKKDYQQENSYTITQNKYNNFFNNNMRKPFLKEEGQKNNIINLELIKLDLETIFNTYKTDLFQNINNVNNYNYYKFLIDKWNEENNKSNFESYKDNYYMNDNKNMNFTKCNSPPIDYIFFKYLKEFASDTNKEYFLFINKFIIFFREWINNKKKDIIKEEYKTEDKKDFSQLFNAEGIPDYCNDFFIEFLEPNKFFGLNVDEFIELTQHFCFWLFLKKYSPNYLLPIKTKD